MIMVYEWAMELFFFVSYGVNGLCSSFEIKKKRYIFP